MLKKAEEKLIVAQFAESQKYLNSAASNYYYNIFMRITHFLEKEGLKYEQHGKGSHENAQFAFLAHVQNELKKGDLRIIGTLYHNLNVLKNSRKKADYNSKFISENEFKAFGKSYKIIDDFLKQKKV